jgi:hypothetical protein
MANKFFGAIGVSGGSDGYLDNIDGGNLIDLDGALVLDNSGWLLGYHLDVDSAAAQSIPTIIQPDANGGDKRWILKGAKLASLYLYEAGTTNLVTMLQSSGNLTIDNTFDTGTITFKGENTGDATMLVMDPAGGVDLYYAGTKEAETESGIFKATNSLTIASTTNVTGILDEDNMVSDSAVSLATQQSIKAYVDTQLTAEDLDFIGDAGGAQSVDLDSQTLTFAGGTGIDTTGSAQQMSFAIDSTVATLTGSQTLTNKTITSPIINTILTAAGKTGITLTEDGSVDLYYNEIKTLSTGSDSVNFHLSGGLGGRIYIDGGSELILHNRIDGENVKLNADDAAGSEQVLFEGDPDGSVDLYYDGSLSLKTGAAGISIYDTSGTDVNLFFENSSDAIIGTLLCANSDFTLSGSNTQITTADAGAVSLYYAGTKVFETTVNGIFFTDDGTNKTALVNDGSNSYLSQDTPLGGNIIIRAQPTGGGGHNKILEGNPDGTLDLYYIGRLVASFINNRIELYENGVGSDYASFGNNGTAMVLRNWATSDDVSIGGTNAAEVYSKVLYGDPDGAAELFYNGTKTVETTTNGIIVGSSSEASITHDGSDLYIAQLDPGNTVIIQSRNVGDTATNTLISGDPDGAAELYYNGTKTLETFIQAGNNQGGIKLFGESGTNTVTIFIDDDNPEFVIANDATSAWTKLYGRDSGAAISPEVYADPDGPVELYYDGTKSMETVAGGIRIWSDVAADYAEITMSAAGTLSINNRNAGDWVSLTGRNDLDTITNTILVGDPDADVELYYDGTKTFWTTAEGAETLGGLKFPATQAPSADANTLDDYEEGTWTPTSADAASAGNTGTTGTGWYTKIGRLVHVTGFINNIDTTGMTAGNVFYIQGLPFANNATIQAVGSILIDTIDVAATAVDTLAVIDTSASAVHIRQNTDNAVDVATNVSALTSTASDLVINITYTV